jgi:hypothetical protein
MRIIRRIYFMRRSDAFFCRKKVSMSTRKLFLICLCCYCFSLSPSLSLSVSLSPSLCGLQRIACSIGLPKLHLFCHHCFYELNPLAISHYLATFAYVYIKLSGKVQNTALYSVRLYLETLCQPFYSRGVAYEQRTRCYKSLVQ